jgi:hypothetical protein
MEVVSNARPQQASAQSVGGPPLHQPHLHGEEMDEINLEAAEDEQQSPALFSALSPTALFDDASELLASNPLIFTGLAVAVPVSLATALRVWHYYDAEDKDKVIKEGAGAAVAVHKR